jgi:hypothetical protein
MAGFPGIDSEYNEKRGIFMNGGFHREPYISLCGVTDETLSCGELDEGL